MWAELLEALVIYPNVRKGSTTEDSSACSSDDESFHSAAEELDEQVEPHPSATATNESFPQPPHRMDQQEISENANH